MATAVGLDRYTLNDDVRIIAVKDLSDHLQRRISSSDNDYVISRTRGRYPSSVIDKATAMLLLTFRVPQTIIAAVLLYSDGASLEPHRVLEESYPVLEHMMSTGILMPLGGRLNR
jgi:hypothetical protein